MAINRVNGNNNTAFYTTLGATAGAGAGAATAYLTRSFLKDGAPTDEFAQKIVDKLETSDSPEIENISAQQKIYKNERMALFDSAKNVEELKDLFVNKQLTEIKKICEDSRLDFDTFKVLTCEKAGFFKEIGIEFIDTEKFQEVKNFPDLEKFLEESFDKKWQGKTLEEIKNSMVTESKDANKNAGKLLFERFWDAKEKKFVNCDEGVGKVIKEAAKSIQGKYALIYGSIGAAVLGLGTYLFTHGKSSKTDDV